MEITSEYVNDVSSLSNTERLYINGELKLEYPMMTARQALRELEESLKEHGITIKFTNVTEED